MPGTRSWRWKALCGPVLLSLTLSAASAPPRQPKALDTKITALLARHSGVLRGRFGYQVVDAESGAVLAERGALEFYTPASNTKLYTTAAALARLGPDYRFHTEVFTPVPVTADGVVPELHFIGGGDPSLSGRAFPYDVRDKGGDPLHAVNLLADQIVSKAHIQTVRGDIVGVDHRYVGEGYPDGWTVDDSLYTYGAPVSALTVNDNTIHITIKPAAIDELADISLSPEVGHFVVLNQILTAPGSSHQIQVTRDPGSRELVVTGTIGVASLPYEDDLGVVNPALFAAQALLDALRIRGVAVLGSARADSRAFNSGLYQLQPAGHRSGATVATLDSAPLSQAIAVVNKVSQNLHAEMLLRELGVSEGGTLKAGVDARQAFLKEAGISEKNALLQDGSGLARQNLTTPETTVKLLRYMWHRPDREVFMASLPIGGVDGSLEHRMKGATGAERIHAKTGSISHVATLSGYVQGKSGRWLIFSLMANAEAAPPGDVRDVEDRICALLLEQ